MLQVHDRYIELPNLLEFFQLFPVGMKLQAFYKAEKSDGAATWSMQFQFKLLFPKDPKT